MNRTTILLLIALIVALVGGWFIFSSLPGLSTGGTSVSDVSDEMPPAEEETVEITRIDAKHYYTMTGQGGVHTVAGELMMQSSCDLLNSNAVLLDEGEGTRAVISFDVVNNDPEVCDKTPTPQRFKIGFPAAKDIKIEAVYKGQEVPLNLIEAGPGESPADFELFLKG